MMDRHVMVLVLMSCTTFFASAKAVASTTPLTTPSLEEVKLNWSKDYQYPGEKFFAMEKLFDRLGGDPCRENAAELGSAQEYLLSEVLKAPIATVQDDDQKISTQVHWTGRYLCKISCWPAMRHATNQLMRIADKVAKYRPLFDLSETDALIMAHQIDHYVEHGTNRPPMNAGTVSGFSAYKPWFGPTGSRVAKIIDFRRSYNKNVTALRKDVLRCFHHSLTKHAGDGTCSRDSESEITLWLDFVRRIRPTQEELESIGPIFNGSGQQK